MSWGEPLRLVGPEGALQAELHRPPATTAFRAVVSHPHPLYGGTMDNAVVVLAARALVAAGGEVLRFNFRGVGQSAGSHDGGAERLDLEAAIATLRARAPALPLILAGYSFGAVMTLDLLALEGRIGGGAGSTPDRSANMPAGVLLIAPPVTHYEGRSWGLGAIPTEVIYGERDGLTPPALLTQRASAWGSAVRLRAIAGAGHDLGSLTAPRALDAALQGAVASLAPPPAAARV